MSRSGRMNEFFGNFAAFLDMLVTYFKGIFKVFLGNFKHGLRFDFSIVEKPM